MAFFVFTEKKKYQKFIIIKIARVLCRKYRTPFKKIAEQLDLSTKTVIQRYRKLRENLFTLSTVTLDLNKLGYKALVNLYIKVSNRSKVTEIYFQLLQIPNVIVIIRPSALTTCTLQLLWKILITCLK